VKDQFQIWRYNFPEKGEHSCVVVSPPDIAAHSKRVNVLFCTSQRQSRRPYPEEVMLDRADGFDWETFVNCSEIWLVKSADLIGQRGTVTHARRVQIRTKVRDIFRLMATD
jgi:mRNA-degrading endonuclease toxin of MazEF toxin-antitoxin module